MACSASNITYLHGLPCPQPAPLSLIRDSPPPALIRTEYSVRTQVLVRPRPDPTEYGICVSARWCAVLLPAVWWQTYGGTVAASLPLSIRRDVTEMCGRYRYISHRYCVCQATYETATCRSSNPSRCHGSSFLWLRPSIRNIGRWLCCYSGTRSTEYI